MTERKSDRSAAQAPALEPGGSASELRFRKLFEGVPIGMFRSTPSGQFLEVNSFLASAFGYPGPAEMVAEVNRVGIADAIFLDPGQRGAMLERLRATAGEWHVEEVLYRKRDGSLLDVILSISLQVDPATGQEQMFGFMQDITERQRQEGERRRREQLMAVGMLASGVAHDFNNMVCGIQGYTQLMAEEADPEALRSLARRLSGITARAHDLTSCLLRFSRQGGLEPAAFSASEAVRNALSLFRTSRGRLLTVRADLPREGPVVLGFATQFQNAVLNLCLNAKDAMGPVAGAALDIRGETVQLDPELAGAFPAGTLGSGPHFHLEVADNGPGMTPEVRARCLDPFYTTKGDHGSGLGLSSVQGAMADHGGVRHIETTPGAGCRVHMFVPVAAP